MKGYVIIKHKHIGQLLCGLSVSLERVSLPLMRKMSSKKNIRQMSRKQLTKMVLTLIWVRP